MLFNEVSSLESKHYGNCEFNISNVVLQHENKAYNACSFLLNEHKIIYRKSKITPTKIGQFVTFWKRSEAGPIEPYHGNDDFNFFVINCQNDTNFGQFIFPKSILIEKGFISTSNKDGKRGFRVYPNWETTTSQLAQKTQAWQKNYFIELSENMDLSPFKKLYLNK